MKRVLIIAKSGSDDHTVEKRGIEMVSEILW